MAEITHDVFDVFHPTPVPLRELSAIVISLEVWRCEINEYRSNNTLIEFYPSSENISLKTKLIPDLPSVIYPMIDKYVKMLGHSMNNWLWSHHEAVFGFHYHHKNCVLELFEDFVCDYDGAIHYDRTAQRMMHCDRFNTHQKFLIACTYCFEDDIRRIGPLGLKKTDTLYENYSKNRHFAYWSNFLDNVSLEVVDFIEDMMFQDFMPRNRPFLEYFWDLMPPGLQLRNAIRLFKRDLKPFVQIILPKLHHVRFAEFLNEEGCALMYALLTDAYCTEEFVLYAWAFVKNSMNEVAFVDLAVRMLRREAASYFTAPGFESRRDLENLLGLYLEVWKSAPERLKRSFASEFASNKRLLENTCIDIQLPPPSRELKLLKTILSYTTSEERNAFWRNCWQDLINKRRGEELHKIMKLCFKNEDEITRFKENVMVDHRVVRDYSISLLRESCFDRLNDFVSFLLPEMHAARNFKEQLLQTVFFVYQYNVRSIISKHEEFNAFINDAFNDACLPVVASTDFKNQLVLSSYFQHRLLFDAVFVPTEQLSGFMDTFVSAEETLMRIKARIIHFLKKTARCTAHKSKPFLIPVVSWCLDSDDEEVRRFRLEYL